MHEGYNRVRYFGVIGLNQDGPVQLDSLKGKLLLASPDLLDPHFHRAVTLVVEHDENGALGLVLNRPTQILVGDLWGSVSESPCPYHGVMYNGGPCPGAVFALHTDRECSQMEIPGGIYFTGDREHLDRLMREAWNPIRFFIGYAGWSADQLESEMEQNSWLTMGADRAKVFDTSPRVWVDWLRRIDPAQASRVIRRGLMDVDPSMN